MMINNIKFLIEKFWLNQLSEKEAIELKCLINNGDAEFKNELEQSFYQSIELKEEAKTKHRIGRLGKLVSISLMHKWRISAAAVILLFIGLNLFEEKKTPVTVQAYNYSKSEDVAHNNEIVEVKNSTKADLKFNLPDGSTITLAPKSQVSYKQKFISKTREIKLLGKAVFKVAKDKKRPFSVITDHYKTTALGTEFEINTFEKNSIQIKLFEGKIKVQSFKTHSHFETVYLNPGQSLTIDKMRNSGVIFFNEIQTKKFEMNQQSQTAQLSFDHDSLKEVFDKLSSTFKVKIIYDAKDLEGLYFTGNLLESDTFKNILNLIANMNQLEVSETQNGFQILKK